MEALIKMAAWLTSHSLHQPVEHTAPAHPAEQLSPGWFEPMAMLGLDGVSYRAAWDALP